VKFLCDEMLKRLGQWLRVAGHDVLILPDGTDDRALVQRAHDEGRLLLTRDRGMVDRNNIEADLLLLDCNDLEDCVAALNERLPVDWLLAPFSRCMNCNSLLVPAAATQRHRVPAEALRASSTIRYCPRCDQLYWDGSHVARMRTRLESWNRHASSDYAGTEPPPGD